jgi:hypothetical protein
VKKEYVLPIISSLLTLGMYCLLKRKDDNPSQDSFYLTLEKAGHPDQLEGNEIDELENSKMVSEGSQFGVQYYNKTSKAEREALEKNKK